MMVVALFCSPGYVIPQSLSVQAPHKQQRYNEARSLFEASKSNGDPEQSILALREMVHLHPDEEATVYLLARHLIRYYPSNQSKRKAALIEAIQRLNKSVALWEGIPGGEEELAHRLFYLGMAHWFAGRGDLGAWAMGRALHWKPEWPEARFNLMSMQEESGKVGE